MNQIKLPIVKKTPPLTYCCSNNREWTMLEISDDCEDMLEVKSATILSSDITFGQLIYPSDQERAWQTVQQAILREKAFQSVYRLKLPSGSIKIIYEQGKAVYKKSGKLGHITGFMSDMKHEQETIMQMLYQYDLSACMAELETLCTELKLPRNLHLGPITAREIEMCIYACQGMTCKEIGKILSLSNRTVETHIARLRMKLGCRSKSQLIKLVLSTEEGKCLAVHNLLSGVTD